MKDEIKAAEKIQLSDEEIANLSDAQFKTLVIRMLTEMVECGHKIEEKVKAMKSEIKGSNSEGKETRIQINGFEQKEEINIWPEQNEQTRTQKSEERLGTSRTTLNVPTSKSQGFQKEKRKSKKWKTYLKK